MSSGKENSDKWNLSEAFIVDLNENLLTQMLASQSELIMTPNWSDDSVQD